MAKFVSKSDKPGMNALNTDFTAPGAGLQQAGVTLQNLHTKWDALYKDRASKAGGSKQLWDNLSRWTTTPNAQHFAQTQPEQAALFNKSVQTGQIQNGLKPQTLAAALDWGIRENDRSQNHKQNFLDSTWGQILGKLAQIGVNFIPGIGQVAAIGLGAALGAAQSAAQTRPSAGGIALGGLSGGLSAYGGGQIKSGIDAAGGVGNYLGNGVNSVSNFIQHPINSLTGGVSGGTAASAANGAVGLFSPGANGAGALAGPGIGSGSLGLTGGNLSSSGGSLAGALGSAGSALTGGGNMSLLDNILKIGNIAAPIVGGILSSNAANKAADIQSQSANNAIAEERRQYDLTRSDLAPWRTAGNNALGQLQLELGLGKQMSRGRGDLVAPFTYSSLNADPSYQFRKQQGMDQINNSGAARGTQLSGATLKALNSYNSDLASQEYGNAFARDAQTKSNKYNMLASTAGIGQAAVNTGAGVGAQTASNIGNYITQSGNAQAAGYVGGVNALTGGFQDAMNSYQNSQLLNRLFPQTSGTTSNANSLGSGASYPGSSSLYNPISLRAP